MQNSDIGYIKTGITFEKFCREYFGIVDFPKMLNKEGEKLNRAIANDFYEDFLTSNMSLTKYKKETITNN